MKLQQIYSKYKNPTPLKLHSYRVAGIALELNETLKIGNTEFYNLLTACLLHDLGNIVKFDFSIDQSLYCPEGVSYYKKAKDDFVAKYSIDDKNCTLLIIEEIFSEFRKPNLYFNGRKFPISYDHVVSLIKKTSFKNAKNIYESDDLLMQILLYSDMRVDINGVSSLEQRVNNGLIRYLLRKPNKLDALKFNEARCNLVFIEDRLSELSGIYLKEISEDTVSRNFKLFDSIELKQG